MRISSSKARVVEDIDPDQVKRDFEHYEREDARMVKFRRGRQTPSAKALEAFNITELFELIASHCSDEDMLSLHDVSQTFRDTVRSSSAIAMSKFFRQSETPIQLTRLEIASLLAFQLDKSFNKEGAIAARCNCWTMPPILDYRLEMIQQESGLNPHLSLLTEIETASAEKTPLVIAGKDYDWHLRAFEPIGRGIQFGERFALTKSDAMFIHLIAIDKKHNAGFHGTRVLPLTDAIFQMFLASRPINLPCFLRVDLLHENAKDIHDELHKQGRFIWEGGEFERDTDTIAERIFVVDHDPMYRTHIVPWAHQGMELGYRTFEETDFETSWVDKTFSPNVRFAELLEWSERVLKMQLAKSKNI